MARPKKNGQYLNVKIDVSVYQRLEDFCEKEYWIYQDGCCRESLDVVDE